MLRRRSLIPRDVTCPGCDQPPQGLDDFTVDESGDIVMTGSAIRALGLPSSATAKLTRARVADGDWDHVAPMYLVPPEILRKIHSSLSALQAQYDQMTSQGQGQPYPGTGSSGSDSAMPSALPPRVLESDEADFVSYTQQAGHIVQELASIVKRRTTLAELEAVHLSNMERILASMVTPPPHGKVETVAHHFCDDQERIRRPPQRIRRPPQRTRHPPRSTACSAPICPLVHSAVSASSSETSTNGNTRWS